ncbi:MAG: Gfo/Idh/MocA family oxidoreductase [Gammaproteobacteria bacterium]
MGTLRAAVIGVGYLGNFHAQKYAALDGVKLAAVVDSDPTRAETIGRQYDAPWFTDYTQILDKVDLASIAVPTEHHYEVTRRCLDAGIHVLVEKPITSTVDEAQDLIDRARARGLVFQVGHLERFNPAMLALQGVITNPLFIESHRIAPFRPRGTDVNVVLDLMIHDIDNILQMVPSEIADIRAVGAPVLTDHVDIANARIEFANGCVANVTASRVSRDFIRKIRIFQPDSYVSIDYRDHKILICRKAGFQNGATEPNLDIEERTFGKADALLCEIQAFINAVRTGTPPVVSGQDGKRALEVALEISRIAHRAKNADALFATK